QAKPRLALFAPLPPQRTGVAQYTYRMIDELRHHCDVTVFVDCGPGDRDRPEERRVDEDLMRTRDAEAGSGAALTPADLLRPDGVTVVSHDLYEAMAAGGGAFDQTLYFLGNSHHHLQAFQANKERRGHVLLHDVRMTELYRAIRNDIPERLVEGSVGRTVGAYYPGRYRPEVEEMDVVSPETAHRFGVLLARGVADEDTELLVHSRYAKTLLRLDGAGTASVPFPMPCPTFSVPWTPSDVQPIISAFGPLDADRQPERLIAAMTDVIRRIPTARLRFVGDIDVARKEVLMDLANHHSVGGSVDFVGELTDEQFRHRQRETWIAVQLRSRSDGGSSETLAELLALGVPTMISDLGPDTEVPDDVVLRVADTVAGSALGQEMVDLLLDEPSRRRLSLAARQYAERHSFAVAARSLAHLLFTSPEDRRMVDLTSDMAHLVRSQRQAKAEIDILRGATSAYLGDNMLLTRIYNGQDLYVDGRDTSVAPALLLDGQWEPETTAVFNRLLRPSDCVIDIGANFGYFGVIAAGVVKPEAGGSVHLIEANPDLADLIRRSVAVNRLDDRATVATYAISDQPGELTLQVPRHLWGSSNLGGFDDDLQEAIGRSLTGGLPIEREFTVPAIDLDRYTAERGIDRVDLVKMDIEGHEELAYDGMTEVIARNRSNLRLLLEFSSGQYRDPVGLVRRLIEDLGSLAAIHPRTGQLIPVSGHRDVLAMSRSGFVMLLAGNRQDADQLQRTSQPNLQEELRV
ncbi:MAG: FkbM family methyltransferase, partial [Actinomycetota bacterium]